MLRKLPGQNKWRVTSKSGRNFGTYTSKSKAETRLAQIEMFSSMRKRRFGK
jgi:hypothetical protein